MKTIIFLFTLVLAGALISSYKQSAQNKKVEKFANQVTTKDFKGVNTPDIPESKTDQDSLTTKKTPEGGPRILFMLSNDKGLPGWSPSLWWSNSGQSGC
jgi:hypothetical protein